MADVSNAWKTWKISLWKLIKKINCTSLGKWKRTSYTVWQILHSWDTRFDRYQKWLCQLVPAAGIGNGKLCWFLFGFLWVFSSHVLCLFYPFKEIIDSLKMGTFFHKTTFHRWPMLNRLMSGTMAKEELLRRCFSSRVSFLGLTLLNIWTCHLKSDLECCHWRLAMSKKLGM